MRTFLGLLALCSTLSACDDRACTDLAAVSVSLEVRSGAGDAPLEDAVVTFTLDDGPEREPASGEAGLFDLAYEEDGTFDVRISAPGHAAEERTYEVGLTTDGCHVESVSDTVVLAPEE